MHRKLAVVDAQVAFVGGINIINDAPPGQTARLDYAVCVEGEVVQHIHLAVRHLWRLVSWVSLQPQRIHPHPLKPERLSSPQIGFLIRDNLRHRRDIEHAYLRAISRAQHEIIIANAYFLPGKRFRRALHKAVQRGVRVVLLLQGQMEYRLQHYATLALYDEMLNAGVEIYEYRSSFMHAKVAVVDGEWATVGSSNIDPFSLWLAREANLVVRDHSFASALRGSLLHEMQGGAVRVDHDRWHRRGLYARFLLRVSYGLVRVLAGLAGYAHRRDDI
jgi:cardiolipin synthase